MRTKSFNWIAAATRWGAVRHRWRHPLGGRRELWEAVAVIGVWAQCGSSGSGDDVVRFWMYSEARVNVICS